MARSRLDAELVRRGLVPSRNQAQRLVEEGRVLVNGMPAAKAASQIDQAVPIEVTKPAEKSDYVSRGAHKLLGALEAFHGEFPSIEGAKCLDAGASTGGFTDVLLQKGAREVVAVDVGYGQLAWKLREDPRVTVLERVNIRHLTPEQVGTPPSLVVADLSFISLTLVLPNLVTVAPGATMMLMVKPQFEAGKGKVGAGGVVRDPEIRAQTVLKVADRAIELGLRVIGVAASPLPGPSGNVEYFLLLAPRPVENDQAIGLAGAELADRVRRAVAEGPQDGL
ncbi:TlyA family RNA methyltransferase [Actinomycetaceae bacterium MB13-C1-2]|nr:TlyA family RNA methyltransferase [Actinomycetaceae bacterium MB13-C1-2]